MEGIRDRIKKKPDKVKSILNVSILVAAVIIMAFLAASIKQNNEAFDDVCDKGYEDFDTGKCKNLFERIEQRAGRRGKNGTKSMKVDPNIIECCSRYRYEESQSTAVAFISISVLLCVLQVCMVLIVELVDRYIQRNTKRSRDIQYNQQMQGRSISDLDEIPEYQIKFQYPVSSNRDDSGLDHSGQQPLLESTREVSREALAEIIRNAPRT